MVRLAFWGGDAQCGQCGSNEVRRAWTPLPPWKRALGIEPCRCEACGATFHVPRRAATADFYDEPPEEMRRADAARPAGGRSGRARPGDGASGSRVIPSVEVGAGRLRSHAGAA